MKKRIVIIGAGIIGCSIANELSSQRTEVHVLEKNALPGEGVTSRNSGVIHAGLYYKPGSLKSQLCIEGNRLLYQWCERKNIAHQKTSKLIIAQKDDTTDLQALYQNALDCDINPKYLKHLSKKELKKISAQLSGETALLSTQSGIVDPILLCKSLYGAATNKLAQFHFGYNVKSISQDNLIDTNHGKIHADIVINCAGLYADHISNLAGIKKYKIYPWRGDYFKVNLPFEIPALIYPIRKSNESGLGLHFTKDTQGQLFLGPDVEPARSKEDFSEKPEKKSKFLAAGQRLIKGLTADMLGYETCGIRPKLRAFDETKEKDFVIYQDRPGFFNLIGMESPGLTAALAIAKYVKAKI